MIHKSVVHVKKNIAVQMGDVQGKLFITKKKAAWKDRKSSRSS